MAGQEKSLRTLRLRGLFSLVVQFTAASIPRLPRHVAFPRSFDVSEVNDQDCVKSRRRQLVHPAKREQRTENSASTDKRVPSFRASN